MSGHSMPHRFDEDIDGVTYCSQCGVWSGGVWSGAASGDCNVIVVRRPSQNELSGLLQIRTGNVTSASQAEQADRWIDVLLRACASQAPK